MAKAEAVLLDYVTQHGIAIEKDDLNHTGLLIPFSYRFWQTEDMVVVGQYDGIG